MRLFFPPLVLSNHISGTLGPASENLMGFFPTYTGLTMYFKIQLFLILKFCITCHGWGGTASSSKTEQCCAPQAPKDGFGQEIVKFTSTKCCWAQGAAKAARQRKLLGASGSGCRSTERLQLRQTSVICSFTPMHEGKGGSKVLLDVFPSA